MLGEIFGPHSRELLARAGLTQGMRVADIGCGTGLVSLWIAAQLGAEGSATGVDMSGEQLRMAEKNAVAAALTNISFHQASAYDTNLPRTKFDLAYSRFLMCHLTTESMWIPAESAAFLISSAFAASGSVGTCTTSNPTSRASLKRSP
jgi:2-polyprenyl-3-methyl-5-hydroxy-6-metoxy-1,4-benzoquinol methylase